jgi:hypothetical protein
LGGKLIAQDISGKTLSLTDKLNVIDIITSTISVSGDFKSDSNYNTKIGTTALGSLSSGSNNTSIGYQSLANNRTGGSNTAIGYGALQLSVVPSNNTAIGYYAGYNNASSSVQAANTGWNNTFLGANADVSINVSNYQLIEKSTAIGYNAKIDSSNQIVLGTADEFVSIPSNRGLSIGKTTKPNNQKTQNIPVFQ